MLTLDRDLQEKGERVSRGIDAHRASIRAFIKDVWGLEPQPVKPAYAAKWFDVTLASHETWERLKQEIGPEWFGDWNEREQRWDWYAFERGKHYSWQQNLILMGIEKAVAGDARYRLSVRSGHGIGKSAVCAWIILWYLYCFRESQVPVTAPTSAQMHDVLWKELSIWILRMRSKDIRDLYEWSTQYIRITHNPEAWFARARTSTKENTEAIAGVHADNVCIVVDEASGVPEQVFTAAQGALTSGNTLIVMISNPTRTTGYFFDSHHRNAADWQLFAFDCEHSPLVDRQYVQDMEAQHGRDSEEFGIRVSGKFPGEGVMDDSGYLQLMPREKLTVRVRSEYDAFIGRKRLGIDPAGEGKDKATFVLRDRFASTLLAELATSNPKQIAERALTFVERYKLNGSDVVIDAFGVGADVGKEIAVATKGRVNPYTVLVGNAPKDEEAYNAHLFARLESEVQNPEDDPAEWVDMYLNLRALMFFRMRAWFYGGGAWLDPSSVDKSKLANEVVMIRYKRTLQGNRIQLMSKKEMLKLRIPSPNIADALALTFLPTEGEREETEEEREARARDEAVTGDDRYNAL